ncbi:uncharacterized protein LOC110114918 isoform X2 [Dendrobium catenatum]|uniref:uncharacterized protein LOC110114918 isoform X2 n=1 Tax=Dendrobium catenatum TaxID=906689 RepID=UPI00109FD531|nr:uncharacterized protein LOC110114918 isoform X2 [Dendrobium catenatum]
MWFFRYPKSYPSLMDSHPNPSVDDDDDLPEWCVPLTFPSYTPPPGSAIHTVAPPANDEVTHATEFMGPGEFAEDGAHENRRKRRPFGGNRSQFRDWYGMRRGVGVQGKFHPYPRQEVDIGAVHFHGNDVQHGKSTVVENFGQQSVAHEVVPKINLSTPGEDAVALEPPSLKESLLLQPSTLPLSWCDVCRVDCNSLQVLENHRTGKRHKRTVQLLERMEGRPDMAEKLVADNDTKPEQHNESVIETSNIKCDANANRKKKRKRNTAPEQPRVCVLCNAVCNSEAMFQAHLVGKKHASRICQFQRPNTIFGQMNGYIPTSQSSTLALQDTQPLYYGLMNCEQPQDYAVLSPI